MKNIKRIAQGMILVSILSIACKKETPAPVVTPVNAHISRIDFDDAYAEAVYLADGNIHSVISKQLNGDTIAAYSFIYNNGKLAEVAFTGKWKYSYEGDLLTKVETLNPLGEFRYRIEFTYASQRLAEKTEYILRTGQAPRPYIKTLYTFTAAGNISRKEIFEYVNAAWMKSEEINIPEYDQAPATSQAFEQSPYLPGNIFSTNNPLREIYTDNAGAVTLTIIHQYKYNAAGKTVERKSTYNYPGFPEVVTNTKMKY